MCARARACSCLREPERQRRDKKRPGERECAPEWGGGGGERGTRTERGREGDRDRETEKGGRRAVGIGEENYRRDNAGGSCAKTQGEDLRTYPKTVEGVGECLCRTWFWGHQAVTVTA